jgi:hypothetical protein
MRNLVATIYLTVAVLLGGEVRRSEHRCEGNPWEFLGKSPVRRMLLNAMNVKAPLSPPMRTNTFVNSRMEKGVAKAPLSLQMDVYHMVTRCMKNLKAKVPIPIPMETNTLVNLGISYRMA